jgi:GAF domain-containing protein
MVARLDELQGALEKQVEERTRQLKATNEVGKVASSILDPDELIRKVTNLTTEQFGYHYSAMYLIDKSEKWAELHEATGEAGNVLKQNRHRLELNGKSMVADSIRTKSPVITQIASEGVQRFANPLLPYIKSEISLPLMIGDRVLGALNVQSTKEADFSAQDVETLQNMASQVAIAIENARLFQEAQRSIKEMQAIQQQYLEDAWSNTPFQQNELEYKIGDSDGEDEDTNTLQIPLTLREQNLGQIFIEGKQSWTTEERGLAEAVAAQAAIALENARLINESRQIASRERMVSEINNKIWASATIEGVLQTTLRELGKRLDASNATIELNLDDAA